MVKIGVEGREGGEGREGRDERGGRVVEGAGLVDDIAEAVSGGTKFVRKIEYPLGNVFLKSRVILPKLKERRQKLIIKPVEDGVVISVERVYLMAEYERVYADVQALLSDTRIEVPLEIDGECFLIDKDDVRLLQESAMEMWWGMEEWQRQDLKGRTMGIELMTQVGR